MHFELDDADEQQSPNTQNASIKPPANVLNSPQINNHVQPTDNYQITRPISVDNLSREEKELLVPAELSNNYVARSSYNPDIMQSIIIDIATTPDKIETIIKRHGQSTSSVYLWRSLSRPLMDSWRAAVKHRTHIVADKFEEEVAILDDQVENDDDYKKTSNRIRRFDRVWSHREWQMSRMNRQDFGDKVEVDQNLTVNPAKARDDAYNAFQANPPTDADYDVITVPQDLNRITDLTDGNDNESNRATDG